MNYYSDDIINNIIDNSMLENIVDEIQEFLFDTKMMFFYFSFYSISLDYIDNLLNDDKNKIAFRCIDNSTFNLRNCPSSMVYRKYKSNTKKEIIYYILMICTKQSFKKLGYATALLDDFIDKIRFDTQNQHDYKVKIVVSSLESAISYYQHYGFILTEDKLIDHPILIKYEKPETNEGFHILQFNVS